MKNIGILIFVILIIFFFTTSSEDTQENHTNTRETPKKTYLDSPINTYESRVEALKISNTIQNPVSTYLNSRVDTMELSKKSIKESSKRMEEQDKAIEALTK